MIKKISKKEYIKKHSSRIKFQMELWIHVVEIYGTEDTEELRKCCKIVSKAIELLKIIK